MAKSRRTEETTDLTRVAGAADLAPFLDEDKSLETMAEYTVLPRLKLIQGQTAEALKDQFGEGSAIIRPGDAEVAKKREPFLFVPLAFFVEWCKWSDRRSELPAIVGRSFEPDSDIAKRAKDPKRRFELYPGEDPDGQNPKKYRYVEHLNFPGIIYGDHPLAGTQVTLSFSRGEYGTGMNFISASRLRRIKGEDGEPRKVPLWAQVWELKPMYRDRGDKAWWGFDFAPPEENLIRGDDVQDHRQQHLSMLELIEAKKLIVDHQEDDGEEANAAEATDF